LCIFMSHPGPGWKDGKYTQQFECMVPLLRLPSESGVEPRPEHGVHLSSDLPAVRVPLRPRGFVHAPVRVPAGVVVAADYVRGWGTHTNHIVDG
jgi:hypothetical protein